jgi:hypothetical protein
MNTANLQLEGLLLAIASLLDVMRAKGLMTDEEVEQALKRAEGGADAEARRAAGLSAAQIDAIVFPIRFLRQAAGRQQDAAWSFAQITTTIGQTKPDH